MKPGEDGRGSKLEEKPKIKKRDERSMETLKGKKRDGRGRRRRRVHEVDL